MKTLCELDAQNPWKDLNFDVNATPNTEFGWMYIKDKEFLEKEVRNGIKKLKDINLKTNPVPWGGRWNSEDLPWLVILGLNPGSGYDNNNRDGSQTSTGDKEIDDNYSKNINANLSGKVGFSEDILSKYILEHSGYIPKRSKKKEKVHYWLERLYQLYSEAVESPMDKEDIYNLIKNPNALVDQKQLKQLKDFFDHIIPIEIFPYHSVNGNKTGGLHEQVNMPSIRFNSDLVKYLIDHGVTVIAARTWNEWEKALGKEYFDKCIVLSSNQSMYITKGNLTLKSKHPRYGHPGNNVTWETFVKKLQTLLKEYSDKK